MSYFKGFFRFILHSFFMSAVLSLSITVLAEELSDANKEALKKTIEMLNNRAKREETISKSEKAKRADNMAKSLVGDGAELDQMYKMAGEMLRKLAHDNSGNAGQMLKVLMEAQKNPEAFMKSMSAEQQQSLQQLGKTAKDRQNTPSP